MTVYFFNLRVKGGKIVEFNTYSCKPRGLAIRPLSSFYFVTEIKTENFQEASEIGYLLALKFTEYYGQDFSFDLLQSIKNIVDNLLENDSEIRKCKMVFRRSYTTIQEVEHKTVYYFNIRVQNGKVCKLATYSSGPRGLAINTETRFYLVAKIKAKTFQEASDIGDWFELKLAGYRNQCYSAELLQNAKNLVESFCLTNVVV